MEQCYDVYAEMIAGMVEEQLQKKEEGNTTKKKKMQKMQTTQKKQKKQKRKRKGANSSQKHTKRRKSDKPNSLFGLQSPVKKRKSDKSERVLVSTAKPTSSSSKRTSSSKRIRDKVLLCGALANYIASFASGSCMAILKQTCKDYHKTFASFCIKSFRVEQRNFDSRRVKEYHRNPKFQTADMIHCECDYAGHYLIELLKRGARYFNTIVVNVRSHINAEHWDKIRVCNLKFTGNGSLKVNRKQLPVNLRRLELGPKQKHRIRSLPLACGELVLSHTRIKVVRKEVVLFRQLTVFTDCQLAETLSQKQLASLLHTGVTDVKARYASSCCESAKSVFVVPGTMQSLELWHTQEQTTNGAMIMFDAELDHHVITDKTGRTSRLQVDASGAKARKRHFRQLRNVAIINKHNVLNSEFVPSIEVKGSLQSAQQLQEARFQDCIIKLEGPVPAHKLVFSGSVQFEFKRVPKGVLLVHPRTKHLVIDCSDGNFDLNNIVLCTPTMCYRQGQLPSEPVDEKCQQGTLELLELKRLPSHHNSFKSSRFSPRMFRKVHVSGAVHQLELQSNVCLIE